MSIYNPAARNCRVKGLPDGARPRSTHCQTRLSAMAESIMGHYENAWQAVLCRIEVAAQACGRDPRSVKFLAVSKTFPAWKPRVHALGQRAFGENYVQEAVAKRESPRSPD